ncbi:hypothetical protein SETIT_5G083900v2 [Setaria italica]|uniref:SIAH-type domain-containing protein n=1 Tax=Setaria italica TaxID=4555 RepID=A0A368R2L0_SETIT|nr:hypothetical protein SETIT_5G083900v2 [Setaria italica]
MSEQQATKRGSAPADGEHSRSGKKPRAPPQAIAPRAVVKQEREEEGDTTQGSSEGEASQGGSEGGEAVASVGLEAMDEPQINLTMGVSLLHCQACILPLKPPTFEVRIFFYPTGRAATYAACRKLDAVLLDAKLPCQHHEFGCKSMVVYYQAADHHAACPWAPCSCPGGCGFLTSPARLVEHFHTDHRWPVTSVRYGPACKFPVPAPAEGCHVLVGEGDRSVFLVSPCALGGAVTAVSLVCVRAGGAAAAAGAAQFKCTLWVELPSNKDKLVLIMSAVRSSDLFGGFPAADKYMFLAVPPVLPHDASGEAPDLMYINIRCDR